MTLEFLLSRSVTRSSQVVSKGVYKKHADVNGASNRPNANNEPEHIPDRKLVGSREALRIHQELIIAHDTIMKPVIK